MNAATKRHRESARRLLENITEMFDMIGLGATSSRASMHTGWNGATLREIPLTAPVRPTRNPTLRTTGGTP